MTSLAFPKELLKEINLCGFRRSGFVTRTGYLYRVEYYAGSACPELSKKNVRICLSASDRSWEGPDVTYEYSVGMGSHYEKFTSIEELHAILARISNDKG